MLHLKEQSRVYDNTAYFKRLVSDYYPQLIQELELLYEDMLVMNEKARIAQLFLEMLINEVKTLWRAERYYWEMKEEMLLKSKFPKGYIIKKQKTIRDLIAQLNAALLKYNQQVNRKDDLDMISAYIEVEYKLNGLLIEKERRIYEISARETI